MGQFLNFNGEYEGLSTEQAENNLELYGYNREHNHGETNKHFVPASVLLKPIFLVLAASAVLYIIAGEVVFGLCAFLLGAVFVITELIKGIKCQEQVDEVQAATSMKFRVVRNGEIELVAKEYLVQDDIMIIQNGENVPADAHLLEISEFTVDESSFTGDHTPISKIVGADSKNNLKLSCVYCGTKVLTGSAVARVIATGIDTKHYKTYGSELKEAEYFTNFEKTANRIKPLFCLTGLIIALAAVLININTIFSNDSFSADVSLKLLYGIGIAMCFFPAQLSSMIRLYYIMGAVKLGKSHAVVKSLRVLEAMNSLTAIVIEKAGTITKSQLEVADIYSKDKELLYNISVLSCDRAPIRAMEQALILHAAFDGVDVKDLQGNELIKAFPYTSLMKMGGNLWNLNGQRLLCIKGSPESLMPICDLDSEQLYEIQKKHALFGKSGLEVVAVAYSILKDEEEIPLNLMSRQFSFMGLIAFTNQTRDTIPFAIKSCYRAGVKVIMTTGDSKETAVAIGQKIGMRQGNVITGEQIKNAELNGVKLDYSSTNIFAGITPDQKLKIVKQLQDSGEIVAIAGETTADGALLQQADVGITMVQNASGVAYEASDILMNDDNFGNIVDALKESRQVHQNIKRCVTTVLSSTIGIALFCLINTLIGNGELTTPLLLGLILVVILPACALCYLTNIGDMKTELMSSGFIGRGVVNKKFFVKSIAQGVALGLVLLIMTLLMRNTVELGELRSMILITYVCSMVTMVWANLGKSNSFFKGAKDGQQMVVMVIALLILFAVLLVYIPVVNSAFGFAMLNPILLLLCGICGFVSQIWYEIVKYIKENKSNDFDNGKGSL